MTTDHLGSPRVLTNKQGEVVSRRDFMPFGEEIAAMAETHRTPGDKYGVGDGVRQKFTGYERDEETGLDFAEARYYYNNHGRFTAVDPLLASGKSADPQTFNRYAYTMNRPLILTDPTGLQAGGKVREAAIAVREWLTGQRPEAVQIPTSLTLVNVEVMNPKDVPDGYAKVGDSQIFIKATYQVRDQNGEPIKDSTLIPLESVGVSGSRESDKGAVQDASGVPEDTNNKTKIGGRISGNPETTNASGQFTDSPLGAATNTSSLGKPFPPTPQGEDTGNISQININISQTIYIQKNDKIYPVRKNNFVVEFTKDRQTITNNNDISCSSGNTGSSCQNK